MTAMSIYAKAPGEMERSFGSTHNFGLGWKLITSIRTVAKARFRIEFQRGDSPMQKHEFQFPSDTPQNALVNVSFIGDNVVMSTQENLGGVKLYSTICR